MGLGKVLVGVCLLGVLGGCGVGAAEEPEDGSGDVADEVRAPPSPFLLQFTGTYAAPPGADGWLVLRRSGSYALMLGGKLERGRWLGDGSRALPATLTLVSGRLRASAVIAAYDGRLTLTRNGSTTVLQARDAVGPNEDLCDASGGRWMDDDVDPATGLYCVCPSGEVYLPSAGGCVR